MVLLDKIKDIFKSRKDIVEYITQKANELYFLSDESNSYTLYFKNFHNNYVLVGDVNFPYSKSDLDREWIDMNKHNFMFYEEFNDVSQLFERNEEIIEILKAQAIDYDKEGYKEKQAGTLPKDWVWGIYDDGSGSLISPTGNHYFSFDWCTTEYKITEKDHYSVFGQYDDFGNSLSFKDFQNYAENYVRKNLIHLQENNIEIKTDSINQKIKEAKEKAKEQSINSRGRDPLKIERDGTTL